MKDLNYFNPLSNEGRQAGKKPSVLFLPECVGIAPKIAVEVKRVRAKVKSGEMKLIENSIEYYL